MKHSDIAGRVAALRRLMAERGWAAVVLPTGDPHGNEYPLKRWKLREWATGFTGSAGTAVVTARSAALWTDSRYWLAAGEALADTPYTLMREGETGVPSPGTWLRDKLQQGGTVAVPFESLSHNDFQNLEKEAGNRHTLCPLPEDDIDALWPERPSLPMQPLEVQPAELAGRTAAEKLLHLRSNATDKVLGIGARLICDGADIAWLLNLRGDDIPYNPVVTAYFLISPKEATLYVDARKVPADVAGHLQALGVETRPYEAWTGDLRAALSAGTSVAVDPGTNEAVFSSVQGLGGRLQIVPSPIAFWRAVKNEGEIEGFRQAMLRDGAAYVRFRRRLDERMMQDCPTTEIDADRLLTDERRKEKGFRSLSFATIAAYGPHGAIVHYEADETSNATLEPHGLLLLDSGAQFDCGTTDITRTMALGSLTDEERHVYTLVLKGHIALSRCRFPQGTTGLQLDTTARYAMWQEGYDFGHGTGHGVGSRLCVHEGPHQIRKNVRPCSLVPLEAGMTVTDEPGIYLAGRFGVRIENTLLVRHAAGLDGFLKFEPLTLAPIDLAPVETSLLTDTERNWLNAYHERVRTALLPLLTDEADRRWLHNATRKI